MSDTSQQFVEREWGAWKVIAEPRRGLKIKELIVRPHKALSIQRHCERQEYWFVQEGAGVYTCVPPNRFDPAVMNYRPLNLTTDSAFIPIGWIHHLINNTDKPLHILEVQYSPIGGNCVERDIIRYTP